jgi:hypothetical protein
VALDNYKRGIMENNPEQIKMSNCALLFAGLFITFFIFGLSMSFGLFLVLSIMFAAISLILSVIAISMYKKHKIKRERNKAIVSLIICTPFVIFSIWYVVASFSLLNSVVY